MQKLYYLFILAVSALFIMSCDKDEDCTLTCPPGEILTIDCTCFKTTEDPEFTELTGNLTTQTLVASKKYLLKGQVFVNAGQTLTIEPGTIIAGDKATKGTLIINRGGKINAIGTKEKPIVMTSALEPGLRDRGDWGGLIILGNAQVNQVEPAIEGITPAVIFGKSDASENNDNSGTLKYLRVEFAGIELTPNNETNSITMGGVGAGTTMEYCQVTFGGDDGFEWFGGNVNGKYFIAVGSWDDCYDVDFGYSGNVQYGLSVRYPSFADQSGSNAFECDNGPNDNDVEPYTTGTFSNFTCIGHRGPTGNSASANYQHALDLRRRTAVRIVNSVFIGWSRGVRFNQPSVLGQYQSGRGLLYNNVLVTPSGSNQFLGGTGVMPGDVAAYWNEGNTTISENATDANVAALGLKNDFFFGSRDNRSYGSNPDFRLAAGTLNTASKFDRPQFDEAGRRAFFQNAAFIGAFGSSEDWTDGWAEFNPIMKEY